MTWTGELVREDFGGPVWLLKTSDQTFQLQGEVPAGLVGRRVTVHGEPSEQGFGFGMSGPVIRVRKVVAA